MVSSRFVGEWAENMSVLSGVLRSRVHRLTSVVVANAPGLP